MSHPGERAIVIGASMGGLLAARVLADHFRAVTVLERDALPSEAVPRKGVPQGRHTHGLLARGREVLEQLFPGISNELVGAGANFGDLLDKVYWYNHGVCLYSAPSALVSLLATRPALETEVRRRLVLHPNVTLRDGVSVIEPLHEAGRVTGVRLQNGGEIVALQADLVVDATGRGSRSPKWLEAMGCQPAPEEIIEVGIAYKTREYCRKPGHLDGKLAVVVASCLPNWRAAAMLAPDADRWMVTLGGMLGDEAPNDDAGFLEFARSLPTPRIHDVLRDAEPLTEPIPHHFPANQRRRYEKLARFPDGYLVFGDALCSFNPIYGQGMTVSCMEAIALRDCLEAGPQGLARRFFTAAARLIDTPWQITVGSDLQHPLVVGSRSARTRFLNWYVSKFYRAGEADPVLAKTFIEVANLMRPPSALMSPAMLARVWGGSWRSDRKIAAGPEMNLRRAG